MSWLMKTAAIELRVTSLNRQRSHTQRLINLLLDDQPQSQQAGKTFFLSLLAKGPLRSLSHFYFSNQDLLLLGLLLSHCLVLF